MYVSHVYTYMYNMYIHVIHISIYIHIYIYRQEDHAADHVPAPRGGHEGGKFGGSHLSNSTCLTQLFFNSGD